MARAPLPLTTTRAPGAAPPAKTCGECGLCCKLLGVEALAKPPLRWCGHYARGGGAAAGGCRIYGERPGACRAFVCQWLKAPHLDDRWRPDRAGFVLHTEAEGRRLSVEVDPASPDSWRKPPFRQTLRDLAARGAAHGGEVRVFVARRGYAVLPDGELDLGLVRPAPPPMP